MSSVPDETEFQARVHQGHVDNFRRKLSSADNQGLLDKIFASIEFAVNKHMISGTDREMLSEIFQQKVIELSQKKVRK